MMDTHRVRNMYSENKQSETSCISLVIYLQDFKDARYHEHKKKIERGHFSDFLLVLINDSIIIIVGKKILFKLVI